MSMTKCKECKNDISTNADTCPHCGAKPYKPSGCFTTIIIGGAIALSLGLIFSGNKPTGSRPFDPEATVRGLCMLQIKSILHDADSAEFEHSASTIASKSGDIWTVQRPVRAKNSFNATRRAVFECRYRQVGENFTLIGIEQIGK